MWNQLYVVDFRRSKTAILTILEALNFDFWKNFTHENVKSSQKFKIQRSSNDQNFSFWGRASNDQNQFHVKSELQKSPEISTLPIPNWAAQVCKNVNENGTIFSTNLLLFYSYVMMKLMGVGKKFKIKGIVSRKTRRRRTIYSGGNPLYYFITWKRILRCIT